MQKKRSVTNSKRDKRGRFAWKGGGVRLVFGLIAAILLALAIIRGAENVYENQRGIVSPVPEGYTPGQYRHVSAKEKRDTTATVIAKYLKKKNSPLVAQAVTFYEAAVKNGLDPYLLVAVAGAESSFGKYTPGNFNVFGWGRGRIGFQSYEHCIETVAYKIATLPYYRDFMANTQDLGEFCLSYNEPEAKVYCKTLRKFLRELESEEWLL